MHRPLSTTLAAMGALLLVSSVTAGSEGERTLDDRCGQKSSSFTPFSKRGPTPSWRRPTRRSLDSIGSSPRAF